MVAWTWLVTIELERRDRFQRNLRTRIDRTAGCLYVERKENEELRMIPF